VGLVGGREESFSLFRDIFIRLVENAVRLKSGAVVRYVSDSERAAVSALAGRAGGADALFALRDSIVGGFALVGALNLDIAAAAVSAFERLRDVR
ncbi:MAG: hypothetical protein LBO78_00995, partial [Rickettsiales bacterium]|jgi:hypothetical protein|nr:hypothetical protein [Rickettsiales bacterium]